jgi:ribose-phosphate pyrophosphokinase
VKRLHCFPEMEGFGRRLARASGIGMARIAVHRFPDGESGIRIRRPAGHHALVLRSLHDPNAKLVEVLLAADALRRAGARRVTLVTPYLPYMRQDRVFRPGEPVSQQAFLDWLGSAFDGLLTVEAHLHRTPDLGDVFRGRARSLSAAPSLARWLRRTAGQTLLVGPDAEAERWVRALAGATGLPWRVARKQRLGDTKVRVRIPDFDTPTRAVIVDDIVSSGATLAATARQLHRAGVRRIEALVVHALFAPDATRRIRQARIDRISTTDTIAHRSNGPSIVPVLAEAIGRLGR